jgi:GntR family transcriptional regulator/MocR family aminotransferase
MIDLQGGAKAPLYEKIYQYIRNEIIDGKIPTGEKLPSTRLLAENLSVSRSTVEMAYDQLLAEGYIRAEACRGFFACDIKELYQLDESSRNAIRQRNLEDASASGQTTGVLFGQRMAAGNRPEDKSGRDTDGHGTYRIDFSPYAINTASFPYNVWRKISKNVLLDDREELLLAGDGQGEYELRKAIAAYLHQARGVNCQVENIIIGAGNEYLEILLTQLFGREKTILMENPGYPQAYHTFCNMGYQVRTVEARDTGLTRQEADRIQPDLIYMMPSHQFPLGSVMPMKQRLELLKWASEQEERYLIEDDYDSEYRYRGKPIPSLQSIDSNGKVIYLGTFSKSIAPSLRISYMVLPPKLLEKYKKECGFYSTTVPRMQQEILRAFIEEGHFGRHLNRMRGIYRSRHDYLLGELKKRTWVGKISGDHAGMHLLVQVNTDMEEEEICRKAAEKEIGISGLSTYWLEDEKRGTDTSEEKHLAAKAAPTLLLGYGKLTEQEIQEGLSVLDEIFEKSH